jgi:hypothetical protein
MDVASIPPLIPASTVLAQRGASSEKLMCWYHSWNKELYRQPISSPHAVSFTISPRCVCEMLSGKSQFGLLSCVPFRASTLHVFHHQRECPYFNLTLISLPQWPFDHDVLCEGPALWHGGAPKTVQMSRQRRWSGTYSEYSFWVKDSEP